MILPRRHRRGRLASRRDTGGIAAAFLTFSLLLLVMALGFVFGRMVIARAYVKGVGTLLKQPGGPAEHDRAELPASTVYAPSQGGSLSSEEPQPLETPGQDATEAAPPSDITPEQTPQAETPPQPEAQEAPADTAREASSGDVRYAVQVGVFGSEESARDTLRQLTRAGHSARIEVDRQSSHTIYRVLTGSYRSEANARKALEQIKGEGFPEAFVVGR